MKNQRTEQERTDARRIINLLKAVFQKESTQKYAVISFTILLILHNIFTPLLISSLLN